MPPRSTRQGVDPIAWDSIASPSDSGYAAGMETPEEIRVRWRYLRDLLIEQLGRFEGGAMSMHSSGEDTTPSAIAILKNNILDFDHLIARSEARSAENDE